MTRGSDPVRTTTTTSLHSVLEPEPFEHRSFSLSRHSGVNFVTLVTTPLPSDSLNPLGFPELLPPSPLGDLRCYGTSFRLRLPLSSVPFPPDPSTALPVRSLSLVTHVSVPNDLSRTSTPLETLRPVLLCPICVHNLRLQVPRRKAVPSKGTFESSSCRKGGQPLTVEETLMRGSEGTGWGGGGPENPGGPSGTP